MLWVKPEVLLDRWEQGRGMEGSAGLHLPVRAKGILASFLSTALCFVPRCLGRTKCRLKGPAGSRVGDFPVRPA